MLSLKNNQRWEWLMLQFHVLGGVFTVIRHTALAVRAVVGLRLPQRLFGGEAFHVVLIQFIQRLDFAI